MKISVPSLSELSHTDVMSSSVSLLDSRFLTRISEDSFNLIVEGFLSVRRGDKQALHNHSSLTVWRTNTPCGPVTPWLISSVIYSGILWLNFWIVRGSGDALMTSFLHMIMNPFFNLYKLQVVSVVLQSHSGVYTSGRPCRSLQTCLWKTCFPHTFSVSRSTTVSSLCAGFKTVSVQTEVKESTVRNYLTPPSINWHACPHISDMSRCNVGETFLTLQPQHYNVTFQP